MISQDLDGAKSPIESKLSTPLFISVSGSFFTGSGAVIDLLREYSCLYVIEDEIKLNHGKLFPLIQKMAAGEPVSGETISYTEQKMIQLGKSHHWISSYGYKALRISLRRFPRAFGRADKKFKDKERTFQGLNKLLPGYAEKTEKLFTDFRNINSNFPESETDATNKIIKALYDYFRIIFDEPPNSIPVANQLLKPGGTKVARLFPFGKFIFVTRDPRDQFCDIIKRRGKAGFSQKTGFAENFSEEYRKRYLHQDKLSKSSPNNTLQVRFEDLIYDYKNTLNKIDKFIGVGCPHKFPRRYFDPDISIKNTQMFKLYPHQEEIELIEDRLDFRLYPFP